MGKERIRIGMKAGRKKFYDIMVEDNSVLLLDLTLLLNSNILRLVRQIGKMLEKEKGLTLVDTGYYAKLNSDVFYDPNNAYFEIVLIVTGDEGLKNIKLRQLDVDEIDLLKDRFKLD